MNEIITITRVIFHQAGNKPAKVAVQMNGAEYEMIYWTGRGITQALSPGVPYRATLEPSRDNQNYVIKSAIPEGQPVGGGIAPVGQVAPPAGGGISPIGTYNANAQGVSGQTQGPVPTPVKPGQGNFGATLGMCFKIAADIMLAGKQNDFALDPFGTLADNANLVYNQYAQFADANNK